MIWDILVLHTFQLMMHRLPRLYMLLLVSVLLPLIPQVHYAIDNIPPFLPEVKNLYDDEETYVFGCYSLMTS
jgi:hypothetical protein